MAFLCSLILEVSAGKDQQLGFTPGQGWGLLEVTSLPCVAVEADCWLEPRLGLSTGAYAYGFSQHASPRVIRLLI